MRFGWSVRNASRRLMLLAVIAVVALIAVYSYIYFMQPFSSFGNDLLSNVISEFASLVSAIIATMVWIKYDRADSPRRIWSNFAIGLWLWFIGELVWGYLNMTIGEVPIGPPDIFWITAYFFLGRALLEQYKILVQPDRRTLVNRILTAILFALAILLLVSWFLNSSAEPSGFTDTLVNAFYPAADLSLALVAFWLANHFQGGALGRPWIGLLIFTVSDFLTAWLQYSGVYAWSLDQGNLLSGISDIAYFSAYLILGLGAFSQWLFLKYGLRSLSETR